MKSNELAERNKLESIAHLHENPWCKLTYVNIYNLVLTESHQSVLLSWTNCTQSFVLVVAFHQSSNLLICLPFYRSYFLTLPRYSIFRILDDANFSLPEPQVPISFVAKLFSLFDKDNDGILNFGDVIYGLGPFLKGPLLPMLQASYNLATETHGEKYLVTTSGFKATVEVLTVLYFVPKSPFEESLEEDADSRPTEELDACTDYQEFETQLTKYFPNLLRHVEAQLASRVVQ